MTRCEMKTQAAARRARRLRQAAAAFGVFSIVSGCANPPRTPDLQALYRETAAAGVGERNPLIVTPGTLGSRLVHAPSGELVWGGERFSADPDTPDGFDLLALPIGDGATPLAALRDDVAPAGLLERARVNFLGAVIEEGVYDGIVRTLAVGGYRPGALTGALIEAVAGGGAPAAEPPTADLPAPPSGGVVDVAALGSITGAASARIEPERSVIFDYDWRRDLSETAAVLYASLSEKRAAILAERLENYGGGVTPVKFDLIAHSMGGLAVRYFLLYGDAPLGDEGPLPPVTWKGAELVEKAVIVGTPHGGSVIAFDNLVNGKSFSPLTPDFQAELLGTHPSTYQLLPRDRHARIWWDGDPETPVGTIYDVALWDQFNWGLLSPEADVALRRLLPQGLTAEGRRARARAHLGHLLRRAWRFHRAIDRPVEPPPGLDLFLVVGGGFATPSAVSVDRATGEVAIAAREEGDGVVLRSSVLLDERVGGAFTAGLRSPLRFRATLFLPDEHVELTKSEVFGDNLLFWLLEEPRRAPKGDLEAPRLGARRLGPDPALTNPNYDALDGESGR